VRVTVTGGTGRVGRSLVARLRDRGDEVTVLSRSAEGDARWDPTAEPAPTAALEGRDAVIHLAGEDVAQRWSSAAKDRIRESRIAGTRNLVAGLRAASAPPRVLVSASASGYYGRGHTRRDAAGPGDEEVDESAPPGEGFLAEVCVGWEREAQAAEELGLRVARIRTGVVLDRHGGALAKMLPPFRLGIGGPVAGGRQWMPWIHLDDHIGILLAALDGDDWAGAVNSSAPHPVTNRDFSRALGRALHRPAVAPVPGLALRALYGEMASIVTTGVRMVPARALALGYEFSHPEVDEALRAALAD
jgi:uncharacterized protein (TIGR01777 family)